MNQTAQSDRIVPLVMCGGAGTRLWPSSREGRPKQFLPLLGSRSTFQDTMLRVADASVFARPIVITNTEYRFIVKEQLDEIGIEADILLEPIRRDSGPAIAAGAVFGERRGGNPVIMALAADHMVTDSAAFVAACREAAQATQGGRIVTFGVKPDRPRPPGVTSPKGISGIPEISFSERAICSASTVRSNRRQLPPPRTRSKRPAAISAS
jgi:mannose-1-phosphate guanylyltransferase/mannose-6-phosphate isomerase